MNLRKWKITQTKSGVEMGVYEGETKRDALDAMARDAGYDDHADACNIYDDGWEVTPVDD